MHDMTLKIFAVVSSSLRASGSDVVRFRLAAPGAVTTRASGETDGAFHEAPARRGGPAPAGSTSQPRRPGHVKRREGEPITMTAKEREFIRSLGVNPDNVAAAMQARDAGEYQRLIEGGSR